MGRRKTWSDVDISAYLDGEMDTTTRDSFETAMAQDPNLRRQVDAMREVVALMHVAPLREPPRNYLLTPGMVTETAPKRAARRRTPLLLMRLATSLTAAAFVVTVGLSVVSRGVGPAMVSQDNAKIELQAVSTTEVEKVVEVQAAETPVAEKVVEKTLSPEGTAASVLPPEKAPAASAPGVEGGGAAEREAEPAMLEAAPASEEVAVDAAKEAPGTPSLEANAQPEAPRGMQYNTTETETIVPEPELTSGAEGHGAEVPVQVAKFPPIWLSGVLGVITLVLLGLTVWMSRRR